MASTNRTQTTAPAIAALWQWACDEAELSRRDPPYQLHQESRSVDTTERDTRGIIGGPPFTHAFEAHLDGKKPRTGVRKALQSMHSRDRIQSDGYRLCSAIIEDGHDDEATIHAIAFEGMPAADFRVMAYHALSLLRTKADNADIDERGRLGLAPLQSRQAAGTVTRSRTSTSGSAVIEPLSADRRRRVSARDKALVGSTRPKTATS